MFSNLKMNWPCSSYEFSVQIQLEPIYSKFLNLILNCIKEKNRGTSSIQLNILILQLTVYPGPPGYMESIPGLLKRLQIWVQFYIVQMFS